MDSSWRDGLAFCALIHHFRPSLIDYDSLSQENILENHTLAYKVAEDELGIPSLLDPEDALDTDVPDRFSIVTYVSQFYHLLKDEDDSRSPSLPIKERINTSYDSADNSPPGTPSSSPSTPPSPSHLVPSPQLQLQGSLSELFVRSLTPRLRFVKRGDMRPYKYWYLE